MEIDKTAITFNSSPLYRFILQEGKFKGVEFYFKNVEVDYLNTPGAFDIAFEYEIIGGNYRDHGYEGEQEYLNRAITDKNRDQFKVEIGKILKNLLVLNDPRVILHKGRGL
jgi:hypothetical protein